MLTLNTQDHLKIIILFALINSSIFIAYPPIGVIRLIIAGLMNISGMLLIIYFFKLSKRKSDISFYFKVLIPVLIIWSLYTIFVSFSLNVKSLITLFGHHFMGWAWMTPLAIVFGFNLRNWISLFNFYAKLLLIGAFVSLGAYYIPAQNIYGLLDWLVFFPVILLTFFFQSKANKLILILAIFSYLLLTYFSGQRANIVFITLQLFFFAIEFFRFSKNNIYIKGAVFLTASILAIFLALQVYSSISQLKSNSELTTDTRTFLFEELFADMSDKELITGRGALGKYYSPYFYYTTINNLEGDHYIRSSVEVGYLEMILKGGYIMMTLYLLILLPAAYLGIFKSNNIIARMSGYYILSYLILWLVSYYPFYSPEFILVWVAAGTAISTSARKIENDELVVNRKGHFEFINHE